MEGAIESGGRGRKTITHMVIGAGAGALLGGIFGGGRGAGIGSIIGGAFEFQYRPLTVTREHVPFTQGDRKGRVTSSQQAEAYIDLQ